MFYRKYVRKTIFRFEAARLAIPNAGVMNDRIEAPESIRLFRDVMRLSDAGQISNHGCLCSRNSRKSVLAALAATSMKNNLVSFMH